MEKEYKKRKGYEGIGHEAATQIERKISLKTPEGEVFPDQLTNNGWILTPSKATEVL